MTKEIWKDVKGYEEFLQISNLGRILTKERMINRGRGKVLKPATILKPYKMTTGYWGIKVEMNGIRKSFIIHRLVAEAFIPNPENKPEVNHIDSDKLNPKADNLEWVTREENRQHAIDEGRMPSTHVAKPVRIYKQNSDEVLGEFSSRYKAAEFLGVRVNRVTTAITKGIRLKGHKIENC